MRAYRVVKDNGNYLLLDDGGIEDPNAEVMLIEGRPAALNELKAKPQKAILPNGDLATGILVWWLLGKAKYSFEIRGIVQ